MEDELEDRVLYQTYVSHAKLMSRLAVPLNAGYMWRFLRVYVLKPEVLVFSAILFFVVVYIQAVDVWSRGVLERLQYGARTASKVRYLAGGGGVGGGEKLSWELREGNVAAFAVQGRRPRMEDRFVIHEDVNHTGVSLFAVFDGHGGEFAANYARDKLIHNLNEKLAGLKRLLTEGRRKPREHAAAEKPPPPAPAQQKATDSPNIDRKKSFRKTASTTDECVKKSGAVVTDPELLRKLDSLQRPITRDVRPSKAAPALAATPLEDYLDTAGGIDYGRLITDEVLAADHLLVEAAKKSMDVAGTTALIALMEGSNLVVANVGDSRGVMCDSKGNAIPLSFDHKPQQVRERKRIKEAGGFVTFNGVWRVAGILATSRAMGDYPLKDKKLVIADPDVLTFDLEDHRPQFLILASDGLWDTFSNEEAVAFVRERLDEPHYGAKSITLQSYYRGSLDNITVVVVNFRGRKWGKPSSSSSS